MKIALLGYGKMGKAIEQIAMERHHSIVLKTNLKEEIDLANVDVAIDFSTPDAAFENISFCLEHKIPIISGTTGWLSNYDNAVALCEKYKGAFIYASNFSLGVNIFFELNKTLAKMMSALKQYNVSIDEMHHTQKLDAPSGTAISLAKDIISEHSSFSNWSLNKEEEQTIPIAAHRVEDVPGTHSVSYKSAVDSIKIKHTAHNREGFALGAIIAAEWIVGKTGVFTMKDVLNIG